MWYAWKRREIRSEYWWENMKEGGHLGDLGVDEKIMLNGCSGDRMGECGLYYLAPARSQWWETVMYL